MRKGILLSSYLLLFLPSCYMFYEDITPFYVETKQTYPTNIKYLTLDEVLNHIKPQEVKYVFDTIISFMCPYIRSYSKIIVTDLPNLSYLKIDKLSSYFGDTLRTSVSDICHKTTILAEFSKYLELDKLGIKVRTRKINKLLHKNYQGYSVAFLTGTYQINQNVITVFIKLINARTGEVICAKEGIINIYP